MKKKILFRGDGNDQIGLGHLYRLLALAEMLKDFYEFIFVTREDSLTSIFPTEYNIKKISFSLGYEQEAEELAEEFNPTEYLIVADGYSFVSAYQKAIKKAGFTLIYIDDLAQEYMHADIVVNHSPSIKESEYRHEDYTHFALGIDYAMLRPTFLKAANESFNQQEANTVFVCFGGADKYNFTLKAAKALLKLENTIKIVLGAAYEHKEIYKLQKSFPEKINLYKNLSEIELLKVMLSCSFAIAPTSTVLYELMCLRLPVISGYYADNQMLAYNWFKKRNCILGIGDFKKFDFEKIDKIAKDFKANETIKKMIKNQRIYFDGNQKQRFVELLKRAAIDE